MTKARTWTTSSALDPPALRMLGEVFDEVWASIAPDFPGTADEIETLRIQLANIVLELAQDGQLSSLQIARTAARLIRDARPDTQR